MGTPKEGLPYWYMRFKSAVEANEALTEKNSRFILELDRMRCANENLKRMNQTQVEQLRDLTHEVAELKDQKETLRANVSYYAKQCRKWSEKWNLQKEQHAATVEDLAGKLDHSRQKLGVALEQRDMAQHEIDECLIEERKRWEGKLYRMKQSRDALWGGVRDALEMLKRRDIKPKSTKKAAIERLEAAKGDGLLAVMEYDSELEKLKEALFEQRRYTDKWREEAQSKWFPGLQFVRIDKDSVLGKLWEKWFPHTPVPKDLTVDRLHRYVMDDYEARLKNVEDKVARSSMEHDCRLVCDMCRQMSDNPFLGEPYPDPLSDEWVHNVLTREEKALVLRCEASAIRRECP